LPWASPLVKQAHRALPLESSHGTPSPRAARPAALPRRSLIRHEPLQRGPPQPLGLAAPRLASPSSLPRQRTLQAVPADPSGPAGDPPPCPSTSSRRDREPERVVSREPAARAGPGRGSTAPIHRAPLLSRDDRRASPRSAPIAPSVFSHLVDLRGGIPCFGRAHAERLRPTGRRLRTAPSRPPSTGATGNSSRSSNSAVSARLHTRGLACLRFEEFRRAIWARSGRSHHGFASSKDLPRLTRSGSPAGHAAGGLAAPSAASTDVRSPVNISEPRRARSKRDGSRSRRVAPSVSARPRSFRADCAAPGPENRRGPSHRPRAPSPAQRSVRSSGPLPKRQAALP